MNDETNITTNDETQGTPDAAVNTENSIPYARFKEVNARAKSAEKRLAELEAAEAARQEDEAKKRGDYDKLINDLKPKAARAAELEATLREYLDAEIADIPEDKRDLIPEGDIAAQLRWVKAAKAKGLFTAPPKAPNMDFAATGDSKKVVKVPETQQTLAAIANQYGFKVNPEQLAARAKLIEEQNRRKPKTDKE